MVKLPIPLVAISSLLLLLVLLPASTQAAYPYYGTKIGALSRLHHGVSGDVYAVDSRTIFIKKFNYDGGAPAAYFYVGTSGRPSNENGIALRDERGSTAALSHRYRNKDITLSLPEGKTLRDIKWFSVWCDEFAVNFGDVTIPNNLDFPRPQKINPLRGVHGVSSDNIVIVDAQTLLVPNFSYDGEAPDAKFWVGRGPRPSADGLRIPDENGKENPLRRYDRKTIVLTLPDDLTIFDIGHFGVWCEAFTVDFGHVRLPEGLNVPPSLKMLGISPQSKLNCEVLYDDLAFEVRWAVAGESIVVQLVAKLEPNNYMAFGISPNKSISQMIGADAVVAWVDPETGNGFAQDYFLEGKAQCSGARGACPDTKIQDKTNSIRLLNAAMVNGYSIVTYQRSLAATDKLDLPISISDAESVVWGIGPLNDYKEVSFHTYFNRDLHQIEFGRQPKWNCPLPEGAAKGGALSDNSSHDDADEEENDDVKGPVSSTGGAGYPPAGRPDNIEPEEEFYENRAQALQRPRPVPTPKPTNNENGAWDIPAIQCHEPEDGVFYAQMGPTGGKHGYPAITGHVGWGISWYINGLLIPEIHVVRGKTYTFVVEGGNNPDIPAKYHPFYITDDPVGGFEHKREEEKKSVRIFAGVHRSRSGQVTPTGVGRLCNWTPDVDGPPADDYQSFGAYQRTLTLKCDAGEPGVITWKPDRNTPDTVYYHCFTHRYLGWKIHVHDACDANGGVGGGGVAATGAASERHEIRLPANDDYYAAEPSIRHETKVSPNENNNSFLLKHQTDLIKNHNMNGTPPKLSFEITKSSEITKLISDGIRAAEALEESLIRGQQQQQQHQHQQHNTIDPNNTIPRIPTRPQLATAKPEILHGEVPAAAAAAASNNTSILHTQSSHTSTSHTQSQQHPKLPIFAAPHSIPPHLHPHQRPHHAPHHHHHHQHQLHTAHIANAHAYYTMHNQQQQQLHSHSPNVTSNHLAAIAQKTIGLSEYLRPPQNAPLFHPVKLPGRRPYPGPIKKVPASRPVLPQQLPARNPPAVAAVGQQILSQPSVIVNHYRKAVPSLLKPFMKEKPFPIQPIAASVLLLGQPTELLVGQRKTPEVMVKLKTKPKPLPLPLAVPVMPPFGGDLESQGSLHSGAYFNEKMKPKAKPAPPAPPPPLLASPAVIVVSTEQPSLKEIASMKPAINHGFKPDSVVVESGFRPIIRSDGTGVQLPLELAELVKDQVAHRREDAGSEIDEVMETDTLFLTAAQQGNEPQSFEPMFIPSPLDSTNASGQSAAKQPQPVQSALRLPSVASEHVLPAAAKLRKPTLEELFDSLEQDDSREGEMEEEDVDVEEEFDLGTQLPLVRKPTSKSTTSPTSTTSTTIEPDYDSLDDLFEPEEDEMLEDDKEGQAAERIDTYYLPPDNRKIPHASLPSGAVYTFDGKSVVDSTLVLPPKLDARDSSSGLSRRPHYGLTPLEHLIRTTPQFGAYHGELPPISEEFLSTERSQQQLGGGGGSGGGQPVTEYSNPVPFSRITSTMTTTTTSPRNIFSSSSITSIPHTSSTSSSSSSSGSSSNAPFFSSPSLPASSSSLRPISTKLHLLNSNNNNNNNNSNNNKNNNIIINSNINST